ncbi:hypothetical protein [Knoellia sp. p5-6-4]|uniref:hypothetical protein n=1 Tax=unclassified Knoellia TaxID=2618719 RepID=UPI0023DBCC10|nr:hypothetical protein [Knoellia sp. p5-6-4]MDF2146687.1 hypothetical protein [Knoellia sp. p5-6-4]
MTVIDALARTAGTWQGTNGFRLMPTDGLFTAPATASVAVAAGGHLVMVGYTWRHPDDGEQQGLLVVGHGDDAAEPARATLLWADSWHQQAARAVDGSADGETLAFEYDYGGGWRWRVQVSPADHELAVRMLNVVPESADTGTPPVGAYEAMVMDLRRT